MNRARIIPLLLLDRGGLYKTVRFKNPGYIGDPVNCVKIFNEKEVDELVLLDFRATVEGRGPDFRKIAEIAGEAFMPMAYGGGIKCSDDARRVFDAGYEKVVLNSALFGHPSLIAEIAAGYGSQAVVASIDVRRTFFGNWGVRQGTGLHPVDWARRVEDAGSGEILLNSIDRDGTWVGYDLDLIHSVSAAVRVPVVACGGAGSRDDLRRAVEAGASAVAAGSLFVYQKKGMGVLISFPSPDFETQ
jgi:cyclase